MSYLDAFGVRASHIAANTWFLLLQSIVVVVIIAAFTLVGTILMRDRSGAFRPEAVSRSPGGLRWISIGVSLSAIALLGSMVWSVYTMGQIRNPETSPKVAIEVTGHQWWWEVRYLDNDKARIFKTANEIHIPVGEPVAFEVKTADVIHSFWVPKISDKLDLIPNQTNKMWLDATEPGVYRGQCAEYCGPQHAHMSLLVIAEKREEFEKWHERQLAPAPEVQGEIAAGRDLFVSRCGGCHTVRGTQAGGIIGPDLSHLMSRRSIAANTLPNTPAYLSGWIANPQAIKPGAKMPNLDISGPELASIRKFLEALK